MGFLGYVFWPLVLGAQGRCNGWGRWWFPRNGSAISNIADTTARDEQYTFSQKKERKRKIKKRGDKEVNESSQPTYKNTTF